MLDFLRQEGINENIIGRVEAFRRSYPVSPEDEYRVSQPKYRYYGTDIWNKALTALLAGENILLLNAKQEDGATTWTSAGKDVTDNDRVADIVAALKGLSITRCTDYKPSDNAAEICGFTSPTATVDVTYLSDSGADQTLRLTIGTKTLAEDGYYVRVDDGTAIYEMPADTLSALVDAAANGLTVAE